MDSADKLAELIRAEQEKTAAKQRAKADAPQRSELDKLIRLLRWIVVGALVVFLLPHVAEILIMLFAHD